MNTYLVEIESGNRFKMTANPITVNASNAQAAIARAVRQAKLTISQRGFCRICVIRMDERRQTNDMQKMQPSMDSTQATAQVLP